MAVGVVARHVPVLLEETVRLLGPSLADGGVCIDATLGLGGHSEAILEQFPEASLLAIDRDERALALARERLAPFGERVRFAHGRFSRLGELAQNSGLGPVRGVLADLGVSSMQLDTADRGFSFRWDAALDMRMAGVTGQEQTAADIVNNYPEQTLANIIDELGEERYAKRIARGIVDARAERAIETTGQLAEIVAGLKPRMSRPRSGKKPVHPATQTFQALRMEVNQELDELRALLDESVNMLEQEGRLVVISYHSLEDRIVKHTLRELGTAEKDPITGRPRAESQVIEVLTKKPIRPGERETANNPRARSARLRAARRL